MSQCGGRRAGFTRGYSGRNGKRWRLCPENARRHVWGKKTAAQFLILYGGSVSEKMQKTFSCAVAYRVFWSDAVANSEKFFRDYCMRGARYEKETFSFLIFARHATEERAGIASS